MYWRPALFAILALLLLVGLRFNAESVRFGVYNDDEYHTIHQGVSLITEGSVETFRAQESVRWLVRLFYPYAIIYLNTHMGGNVYMDGWSYPGHNYVERNFVAVDDVARYINDPNLRLFFHALRVEYILFVGVCVMALLAFFYRERQYLVAFGALLLLGLNVDLITEQRYLYIEPGMLAALALLMLAYVHYLYRGSVSKTGVALLGFLAAFAVSTKFSAVLFATLPIVLLFYLLNRWQALRYSVLYLVNAAASYLLINAPAFMSLESFNRFLHDLSSNFWQYATGSDPGATIGSGLSHWGMLVYQLEGFFGFALYAVPILFLFALWYAGPRERMMMVPLGALAFLSIAALAGQEVYLARNLVPFYLPLAIAVLVGIEVLVAHVAHTRSPRFVGGALAVLIALWLGGVVVHMGGLSSYLSNLVPSAQAAYLNELKTIENMEAGKWYAIGFPDDFFAGTGFAESVEAKKGVPAVLSSRNYPALLAEYSALASSSVVLVNGVDNNKHLASYVLPKYFSANKQFAQYYVFFNGR